MWDRISGQKPAEAQDLFAGRTEGVPELEVDDNCVESDWEDGNFDEDV